MKSNLKKTMCVLAASAVLALSLAGCGGTAEEPAQDTQTEETTISGTVSTKGSRSSRLPG